MYTWVGNHISIQADVCLKTETVSDLWRGFCFQKCDLSVENGFKNTLAVGNTEIPDLDDNLEYRIVVDDSGFAVRASDQNALIQAFMSLLLRIEALDLTEGKESFKIENCRLDSRYSIKNRMIHLCVFPETSFSFLKKTIRLAGIMQYTHVILEFWGMLKYDCMKELAWETAFSKAEVKELVREIEEMGMEAIPMFNHLGHASGCRASGGKHVVLDQNPQFALLFAPDGWSWNIKNPDVKELLKTIRGELYELFPNTCFFHLGCDEVYSYESGENSQRLMREYLSSLINEVREEGRRPLIWGDMLLNADACGVSKPYFCGCDTPENAEKLIEALPKETIIADWHYDVLDAPVKTSIYLKNHGFDVLGTPWFSKENCQAHIDTIKDYNLMGIMVTTWHTLAEKYPHIVEAAVMMGAYHSPWSDFSKNKIRTETASLLRKLCFINGNYREAGWTDSQVFLQAYPMS